MTCRQCKFFTQCIAEATALNQIFDPDYDGAHSCGTKQFIPMTNADRIRAMSDEELARCNVYETYECDVDYDYNEEPYETYRLVYKTSDGNYFFNDDRAVDYELFWLQKPVSEVEE